MTKTTEVAKAEQELDMNQVPAYLQDKKFVNEDNFDSSDVVLPKIKLLQGLSEEVEMYEEAKAGDFWHTGLDINLGSELKIIVADRRKKYLLSAPLSDGQGILARADDAKTWDRTGKWNVKIKNIKQPVVWEISDLDVEASGLAKWGSYIPGDDDSPPAATLFYDYLVYTPDFPELDMSVISLARTQIRPARKGLNDKIKMQGDNGRPMQSLVFVAKSVEETSDDGPYKNWHFRSGGFVHDASLFELLLEYRGALANIKIKDEDEGSDVKSSSDTGEGSF